MARYEVKITIKKSAKLNYRKLLGKEAGLKKGRIKINESADAIKIGISADDVSSFRAAFNSLTKDIGIIENVSKIQS